jgi:hypothetical protein
MCLSSRYAEWRRHCGVVFCLQDKPEPPPERLLQTIWFHQRVLRESLSTTDGRRLQVLHPGFWNRERGPDFRRAVLRFEREEPCTGDVEIDLHSQDWYGHRHQSNPDYQKVILHVVWTAKEPAERPTLALPPVLDSRLSDLAAWVGAEGAELFPLDLLGHCCAPLRQLEGPRLRELLHEAATVRLRAKASWLQARARQAGWEQALWEGLFRALGYKQNLWPMQQLAELRLQLCPNSPRPSLLELQARLLGTANLLPEEVTRRRKGADKYLRLLWDYWWRLRESLAPFQLPRALWNLSGQRPANHPQRRLALASHWLLDPQFISRIEAWGIAELSPRSAPRKLLETLQVSVEVEAFWSLHWSLYSARLDQARPLLGAPRATDLAMNVLLPWLWVRAVEGKNPALQAALERRYFEWPSAEDNSLLRLARQRLLARRASGPFMRGAAAQQGLLQIVKDFCENSNSLCAECRFPELVRQWPDHPDLESDVDE